MSSLVPRKEGDSIYFYHSVSFRNEKGKTDTTKKYAGVYDKKTGFIKFNEFYTEYTKSNNIDIDLLQDKTINRLLEKQLIVQDIRNKKIVYVSDSETSAVNKVNDTEYFIFSREELNNSEYLHLGTNYFLDGISQNIGLKQTVQKVFPNNWPKILTIAYYLILEKDSVAYCEDWVNTNICYCQGKDVSSHKISELLLSITNDDKKQFIDRWSTIREEGKFFSNDTDPLLLYPDMPLTSMYYIYNATDKAFEGFEGRIRAKKSSINMSINIEGRYLICLISNILLSFIDQFIREKNLHKKYSLPKIFKYLDTIVLKIIKNNIFFKLFNTYSKRYFFDIQYPIAKPRQPPGLGR
jgi:hypothetical protein